MIKIKLLLTSCFAALSLVSLFAQAPVITSTSPLTAGTVGVSYKDTLKATGTGPITWTITGLPAWATLSGAVITGTPTVAGTTTVQVTAGNSSGTTNKQLTLTIVPAAVPSAYTQLYAQLQTDLQDLSDTVHSLWNGALSSNVLYAGQLTQANCNNGPALVTAGSFQRIETNLLLLKAEGVKAVSVEVSFPMLYAPFLNGQSAGLQNQFLAFYAKLADTIRAKGFKLIVECQTLDGGSDSIQANWFTLNSFYAGIPNFKTYISERSATAALVASTMKPDYMILQEEPDTEEGNTGQPTFNCDSTTVMLDSSLAAVRALAIPGMKIGAGFGPWFSNYESFLNSYTQTGCSSSQACISAPLDFLDLHFFPIIEQAVNCHGPSNSCPPSDVNFQKNFLNCLSLAKSLSIPVTISQTWLRKAMNTDWELINDPPYSSGTVDEAREPYSFWIPEDTAFIHLVYDLANYQGMEFMVPFNTTQYSAYMDWSPSTSILGDCGGGTTSCGALSPSQVFKIENTASYDSLMGAVYTTMGHFYHDKIVNPADVVAPSKPMGVTVVNQSTTKNKVSWLASTDNIGVAGYHVWRINGSNSVQLHDIFQSPLIDSGLTAGITYCYQLKAFDLAGNVSIAGGCSVSGINNIQAVNEINIYPNPANGQFTIETNSHEKQSADLYDVNGRHIFSKSISGKAEINVSNLDNGVYTLTIKNSTGSGVINKKLVIAR